MQWDEGYGPKPKYDLGPTQREKQAERKVKLQDIERQIKDLETRSTLKPKLKHRLEELKAGKRGLEAHIKVEARILKREQEEKEELAAQSHPTDDTFLEKVNQDIQDVAQGRNIYRQGY